MIEVKEAGAYIIQTVHGSYVVEHLLPRHDYSHMVAKIISGPFNDVKSHDNRWLISGHRLATQKLSEHLSGMAQGRPADSEEALQHDLQQIRDAFSGDPKKLNKLIFGNEAGSAG